MLDNTQSIICAFGLAAAAPRSPYRHLELCGIALTPDKASLRLIIPNWIIRRRDFLCQTRKPKLNGCTTASTMPLSNAAGCTPAGPGPAAPPDDEQYRGRPLPGGASDRGLTRRQGREKACVLTAAGAAYSAKHLASLNAIEDCTAGHAGAAGGGFLFCGCGASPLDLNLPLSGTLYFVEGCHIRLRHFSRRFVDFMAIIRYTERYGCFAIL